MPQRAPIIERNVPNGPIVLIGGGEFSFGETREIDDYLISILPPGNRTIAFLPTASGSNEYAVHLRQYFQTLSADVQFINVPVYRDRDARRGKNLELIRSAGLIYIGGGLLGNLLKVVQSSPIEDVMRDAVRGGVALAAIGAGAAALGRAGLNWINDAAIVPGFSPQNDAELRRQMMKPEVRFGIGLPSGTALAIAGDGSSQILGAGSVAIVRRAAAPVQ